MPDAKADRCLFIIMGATGDLMERKILPALYNLAVQDQLAQPLIILGAARASDVDDAAFRRKAREILGSSGLARDEAASRWCNDCLYYQSIGSGTTEQYRSLAARIAALEQKHELPGNRVFYLALPPAAFAPTVTGLGEAGLNHSSGWTRLVVEKPFGYDLKSAQELNATIHTYFDEAQIYRIDHYLGKETVQNLFVFRFANPIFETLWSRDRIENVQITVAEKVGVEDRAGYYEHSGVLRDMVQNHLTQLLCVVAMEVPSSFSATAIRNEKIKVLESLNPIQPDDYVLGQYTEGLIDNTPVAPYRHESGVNANSQTPTYAAMKLDVANWRWHGVPFYLRTGKRLKRRMSQIVVTFRCAPVLLFNPFDCCNVHSNVLVITIQPDEGFDLQFEVKIPGQGIKLQKHSLHFRYGDVFNDIPEAYETLLLDVVQGDQSLFVRSDWVENSWEFYAPLLEQQIEPHLYNSGTWGPAAADTLLAKNHHEWVSP